MSQAAERHEATAPLWSANSDASRREFPALTEEGLRFDVAVLGGGIAGLMCALQLKEAGMRVAVLEARRVVCDVTGHSFGMLSAIHGPRVGKISARFDEDAALKYIEMNQAGQQLLERYIRDCSIDCDLEEVPIAVYATNLESQEGLRRGSEAALKAGMDVSMKRTAVAMLPFAMEEALEVEGQARLNPVALGLALASLVDGDGSRVFENTRVCNVSTSSSPHDVTTVHGELHADSVVVTTHLPFLNRGGHFAVLKPVQSYCIVARLERDDMYPTGMLCSANPEDVIQVIHTVQTQMGERLLLVGGCLHPSGEAQDTRTKFAALEEETRRYFAVESVKYQWSSLDYMSPDDLPYIGYLHRASHTMFTITGLGQWGYTTAAAGALIIRDLIKGVENPWQDLVDARRWDLGQTIGKIASIQGDVAKHFVGDRLKNRDVPEVDTLPCGEGGICKCGSKSVAAYRDDKGALTLLSPKCQHMGCHVAWNAAEKTWDCPCHGSRYNARGKVIHGPSTKDLSPAGVEKAPNPVVGRVTEEGNVEMLYEGTRATHMST